MGWWNNTMEWVGKAMPNEISKLNSIGSRLPYVGQFLGAASAIDNYATTYNDIRDRGGSQGDAWGTGIKRGYAGYQHSQDPGIYGSPGDNINRDWANMIGQGGEAILGGGGLEGITNNPYFWKQEGDSIPVEEYKEPNYGGFVGDFVGGFKPELRFNKNNQTSEGGTSNTPITSGGKINKKQMERYLMSRYLTGQIDDVTELMMLFNLSEENAPESIDPASIPNTTKATKPVVKPRNKPEPVVQSVDPRMYSDEVPRIEFAPYMNKIERVGYAI